MKGGGIIIHPEINEPPDSVFEYFINNSNIAELTTGTFGVILKLTFRQPARDSPYLAFDRDNFARPVMTLIVKISVLGRDGLKYKYRDKSLYTILPGAFQKEIDIQKDIVEKTLQHLNPISPSIVFSSINYPHPKLIKSNFRFLNDRGDRYSSVMPFFLKYGVIAMESMENMSSVYDLFHLDRHFYPRYRDVDKHEPSTHMVIFNTDEQKQLSIANYMYKLIQLAQIGYVHGDFHTGNVLINRYSTILIDFGRTMQITPEQNSRVNALFAHFIQTQSLEALQSLVDYIFELNYPIFETEINRVELIATVEQTYGWFKNPDILQKILQKILIIHNHETQLDVRTRTTVLHLLSSTHISSNTSQISFPPSTDFLKTILTECAQEGNTFRAIVDSERETLEVQMRRQGELEAEAAEAERQRQIDEAAAAERQRQFEAAAAEAERQRQIDEAAAAEAERQQQIDETAARQQLLARQSSILYEATDLLRDNSQTNSSNLDYIYMQNLNRLSVDYKENYDILINKIYGLLQAKSLDTYKDQIKDLLNILLILNNKSMLYIGGKLQIQLDLKDVRLEKKIEKTPNKNDKQIQGKIAEIKQIQATMSDTFAEWRYTIYDIYTNPNIEEKNAYYQRQSSFTILIHLMVCCGLFGPLKNGSKYIDVTEEDPLYNKLNLIANAFVTMNKGYVSMSTVKMQLMIENAKKASVTLDTKLELSEPTVDVSQDSPKNLPGTENENNSVQREELAGFGGNKKYSTRKRRRHSKGQKKCCRRKSNKRFYSKKCTKKRRK